MGSGDGRFRHLGLIAFAQIVVPNNIGTQALRAAKTEKGIGVPNGI